MLHRVPRWYRQFRLLTFLLLLAIASCCLAFEVKFVQDRREALADRRTAFSPADAAAPIESIPWIVRMRGEYTCREVVLFDYDPKKLARLKSLFPEAAVRHACSLEFEHEFWSRITAARTP